MRLIRKRPAPRPVWYDDWPLVPPPDLVGSEAARRFTDALRRFLSGEVAGRSFLIAGHRGAGKTTLVRDATERLTHEIFGRLQNEATLGIPAESLAAIPQRPLLVRVNAPSLIVKELPGPGAGERTPALTKLDVTQEDNDGLPTKKSHLKSIAPPTKKQSILVQLTTALYRTLAQECATAFAIHARAMKDVDASEISARLQLALDEASEPALLRAYWQQFDALEEGVFFPEAIGRAFADAGLAGQGLREIVAIATAAQIFDVAAGKVEFSRIKKDSSKVAQEAGKGNGDAWSEALRNLFGFAVGAGLGGSAAAGLDFSGTTSLLAGLAGGLASGWTSSHSRAREDTLDYKVTVDRSETSLERDLPLALERIRAAGFAPVFLIDELDKLDLERDGTGGHDIETTMDEFIQSMKPLTTDYGFFCFLVDRAYFDRVQVKIKSKTYPIEYSFFSERLYVSPGPGDFEQYASRQFPLDMMKPSEATVIDQAAQTIFIKHLLHRSKLNMLNLIREIDAVDEIDTAKILSDLRYRLDAAIQMAIETIMAEPPLAARSAQELTFRQLLNDALYIISRAWESGATEISLGEHAVAEALVKRMYKPRADDEEPEPEALRERLEARIGKRQVNLLIGATRKLAGLLANTEQLLRCLDESKLYSEAVLDIVTRFTPILELHNPQDILSDAPEWKYQFRYDQYGSSLVDQQGVSLPQPEVAELASLWAFGNVLRGGNFPGDDLRLDDLIEVGLWPAGLSIGVVSEASHRLFEAIETRLGYAGYSSDKATLKKARRALDENLRGIGLLIPLAIALRHDAELDAATGVSTALRRMETVLDFHRISQSRLPAPLTPADVLENSPRLSREEVPPAEKIARTPDLFVHWIEQCERITDERLRRYPKPDGIWARCATRLLPLFGLARPSPIPSKLDYDDLIVAAKGILPAPLLRRELATPYSVGATDWSLFALEALTALARPIIPPDRNSLSIPAWMAVPALFALGFGPSLLTTIAGQALEQMGTQHDTAPTDALRLLNELPAMASPSAPPGLLLILADGAVGIDPRSTQPGHPPVFLVGPTQVSRYAAALDTLRRLNAFQGKIDEFTE